MTRPSPRLLVLLALLAGLGAWILLSGDGEAPPDTGQRAAEGKQEGVTPAPSVTAERLPGGEGALAESLSRIAQERQQASADRQRSDNLFSGRSWYVPPPPRPAPPPPPPPPPRPPSAPPLPYSFVGSYEEGGKLIIFLARGNNLYTVSPGDVIDGSYRVDGIVSGRLGFTYLPNNIRQSISVGGNT